MRASYLEAKAAREAEEAKSREEAAPPTVEVVEGTDRPKTTESKAATKAGESKPSVADQESKQDKMDDDFEAQFGNLAQLSPEEEVLEEFLAQVNFKRTTEIDGYSETKIDLTFTPYKQTEVEQVFTLFLENQDFTEPIPIKIRGRCVHVPIYVEREEYNMNVLVYEQWYRQRIVLHNRSSSSMKIQLFCAKDFKPYLEFNPTLGYIPGNGSFEIWLKFRPDRSILTTCNKYLVK